MLIFAAKLSKKMERNLFIELLEDGDKVSLYSPHFDGEEYSENLHRCVQTLQKIDIQIKQLERQKVIVVTGTQLLGELTFTIDD